MLYTIAINQAAYEFLKIEISLEAASVMNVLQSAAGSSKFSRYSIKVNKDTFYWFSYDFIVSELPILFKAFGLNTEESESELKERYRKYTAANMKRVIRLMDELCELGLIERKSDNRTTGKTYFRITELADKLQRIDTAVLDEMKKNNFKIARSQGKTYNEAIEKGCTNLSILKNSLRQICTTPLDKNVQAFDETLDKNVQHIPYYSNPLLNTQYESASPIVEAAEKEENPLIDLQTELEQDAPLRPATSFENQTKPIEVVVEPIKAKATEKAIKEMKAGDRSKHLHQQMVDFYNNFYFLKTGEAFTWGGKHLKAVKELREALEKKTFEKFAEETNDKRYMDSFIFFIESSWSKGDNFLRKNFTPSYLNSKFNEIILILKSKEVNNAAINNNNKFAPKYTSRIDEFIASVHH